MKLTDILIMYEQFVQSNKGEKVGIVSTLSLIILVTFNGLTVLYKELNNSNFANSLALICFGFFVLFNVLGNMYRTVSVDTTINSIDLPTVLLPEWRYCSFCEQNAPPRCFHCFNCNRCVLKRHNHCLFLGKCAGHKNQRFYLLFILYVWIGISLANYVHSEYYLDVFWYSPSMRKVFTTLVPMFGLMIGMVSLYDFAYIFINSVTLILFPLMLLYVCMNYKMALYGQTWYESARNIKIYDLGILPNFHEIFGNNWVLGFVNPFAELQLPSDGTRFRISSVAKRGQETNLSNSNFEDLKVRRRDNMNAVYNF